MSTEFTKYAIQRAKELTTAAFAKGRIGSYYKHNDECVAGGESRYLKHGSRTLRACKTWKDNWKCLERRGPEGYLCRKFKNPRGRVFVATDCATYVREVLSDAFSKTGNTSAAIGQAKHGGFGLIKYLVKSQKWVAIYWNPDVLRPPDVKNAAQHPASYIIAVKGEMKSASRSNTYRFKKNVYVARLDKRDEVVDIVDMVVQYKQATGNFTAYPSLFRLNAVPVPHVSTDKLKILKKVKFGVVTARAGFHNALLVNGKVWEAHWGARSGTNGLYTSCAFEDWRNGSQSWGSGLLVVPQGEWPP